MQLLIVEDEPDVAGALCDELEAEGYDVAVVHDGRDALEHARRERPALIFCDLMLPRLNGLEFLGLYLPTPTPHAPVIATSAVPKYLQQALECGAAATIEKPYCIEALLRLIREFVPPQREHRSDCASEVYAVQ